MCLQGYYRLSDKGDNSSVSNRSLDAHRDRFLSRTPHMGVVLLSSMSIFPNKNGFSNSQQPMEPRIVQVGIQENIYFYLTI